MLNTIFTMFTMFIALDRERVATVNARTAGTLDSIPVVSLILQ